MIDLVRTWDKFKDICRKEHSGEEYDEVQKGMLIYDLMSSGVSIDEIVQVDGDIAIAIRGRRALDA